MSDGPKQSECLECGRIFLSLEAFADHVPDCVPTTATMTPAELDAIYKKANEMRFPRSTGY